MLLDSSGLQSDRMFPGVSQDVCPIMGEMEGKLRCLFCYQ